MRFALLKTPWLVYVFFAYCLFIGLKALRPRTVSIWRLPILPTAFSCLSLYWLYSDYGFHWDYLIAWLFFFVFGIWFGELTLKRLHMHLQADKRKKRVRLPGSWITLIMILAIFTTRYTFNALHETHAALFTKTSAIFIEMAANGLIIGLFTGRFSRIYSLYKKAPHTDLRRPT